MNTLPNHIWADSMADWAEHNALTAAEKASLTADYTPANRHEGASYTAHRAPLLPADRMWTPRRFTPEMAQALREAEFHSPDCGFPFKAASSCTEIGAEPEPQTESADGVFWVYMATIGSVIAAAAWAALA